MAKQPPEGDYLRQLSLWLDQADKFTRVRWLVLRELGFAPERSGKLSTYGDWILSFIDTQQLGFVIVWLIIACLGVALLLTFFQRPSSTGALLILDIFSRADFRFVLTLFAAIFAYHSYRRNLRNNAVDYSLRRKDAANAMITQHAALLMPLVQNALISAPMVTAISTSSDQAKIDMYVFAEIDNLEYVFEKVRHHLIEEEYALRAIKIFVARAENLRFAQFAQALVIKGRYNSDFQRAALALLAVGDWRRNRIAEWA
jgi:hypothetical protein